MLIKSFKNTPQLKIFFFMGSLSGPLFRDFAASPIFGTFSKKVLSNIVQMLWLNEKCSMESVAFTLKVS